MDRPASPTKSAVSALKPLFRGAVHRLHTDIIDGQKAVPAIGSSKANAIGLLDAHMKARDDSPERSGRSSPVSLSGAIRGSDRPRSSTAAPISTYDGQETGISSFLARRRYYWACSLAMFFVSASDDKTVKVWDTARLERNVTSKPRHIYGQHHARVKAIYFVSVAEDGSVHVVRVHVSGGQGQGGGLPKYGKLQTIREHHLEAPGQYVTCMAHYTTAMCQG